MVSGYLESEEGQKAFADIGQGYPKSLNDELYDEFLNNTTAGELLTKHYPRHKEKEVRQIRRVKDADGSNNEYIVYSFMHYRVDRALNLLHKWRSQVGKYPIPQASYTIQQMGFGREERKFQEIVNIEKGYSIPYSPEKVDEIKNIGLSADGKIEYLVEAHNGIRITVPKYEDFRNGKWEELFHFGKIPTELQRRLWLEKEGGIEGDKQRLDEHQRMIEEREIPPRMPTMRDVKNMIEEAVAKKEVSKEEAEALEKAEIERGKPEEQAVKEVNTSKRSKAGRSKNK